MSNTKLYRKFLPQQKKIEELEKTSPRFRRVYTEYESMSEDLWTLENSETSDIPEDFLDAIKLQTSYLEDEIEDWLIDERDEE